MTTGSHNSLSAMSRSGSGLEPSTVGRPTSTIGRRARGLSLVEMLISLAITAMLLTATMVAIDASFQAYAVAAETASKQTATRLTVHRLLKLVRTSTAHGPTTIGEAKLTDSTATKDGEIIHTNYIELVDSQGQHVMIKYDPSLKELWVYVDDDDDWIFEESETQHALIGGVGVVPENEGDDGWMFSVRPRLDRYGVPVLERGSLDMKVERDEDNTLAIEASSESSIRVIASTKPRKLN